MLFFALCPFCVSAQSMTILGGNLYVGNENSYVEYEVPDIDGIDPVTIGAPLVLPGAVFVSKSEYLSPARLTIRAPLTSAIGYVGYSPNGSGSATVTGPEARWTTTGPLHVGITGTGWFRIQRGGMVQSGSAAVGGGYYANGIATVTGAGSRWSIQERLEIGFDGRGKLYVEDDAEMSVNGPLYLGPFEYPYDDYRAALHVRSGGQLRCGDAYLGGGRADTYVQGLGSFWRVDGMLALGNGFRTTLFITAGGMLQTEGAWLGRVKGDSRITVKDAESLWINAGTIAVGTSAERGSLLVADAGRVSTDLLHIGAKGSVRLANGGTVSAAVRLDGGKLRLETASNLFDTLDVLAGSRLEFVGDEASSAIFAPSANRPWTGVLTVAGYVAGHDTLRVGSNALGLSSSQLSKVYFADYKAYAQIDADGYVTPVGL
jgi:T5SS/PEP-CTERM-associated repeat protein